MRTEHFILLTLLLVGFITMPVITPTIKTTQPYSVFNREEDGCYKFFKLMYSINHNTKPLIYPYSREDLKENSVLFIISPDVGFTKDEVEDLKDYVSSGNILIVADNFRRGNDILKHLNISYRFSKNPLYDITKPIGLYSNGYILLENSSAILGEDKGTVIMYSSKSSRVGEYPEPAKESSYPIIIEKNHGKGKIVLISDPTIFKNELFSYNREFLKSYFNYSEKNAIYFDEYHHSDVNPQNIVTIVIRSNNISHEFLSYLFTVVLIITVLSREILKLLRFLLRKLVDTLLGNTFKYENELSIQKVLEDVSKKYHLDKSTLYKIVNKILM
ncbi:DUF4350 domain-containing protein [Methanothermococcus sp. SCGC AD-155-N22]|nr:DUF4350 domain-containing protein [Methanothermococcus sp. SCGC AD-155-N22]